jgi:hypothetical protein
MQLGGLRLGVIVGTVLAISVIAGTGVWLTQKSTETRERELVRHAGVGLAFADSLEKSLIARQPASISPAEAVAALYLERLRLGLGSPFRLIEQALRDPALQPIKAGELAEGMLARTMMGDAYSPRPAALDLIHAGADAPGLGAQHQAIIDSVVASYPDPRVGELAIRLAYRLAAASGAVTRRAPEIATAAAAQSRDRILSMRDARAVFAVADRDSVSRLTLVKLWRYARRFEVERPVIVPLTTRAERDAVDALPSLVARIESAGQTTNPFAATARSLYSQSTERRRGHALPGRMAAVATRRDQPPQAPIMIAVRGYGALLRNAGSPLDRQARARFVDRTSNEETLAAEYAVLTAGTRAALPEADATVLTAAVALRPFAQERAWLPGEPAPTARDLQSRFGVAVTYDRATRGAWRPFLQQTLETAIVDMRRVLPGFDPRGLRVHFGTSPLGDRALALHDPIRRTIYFPPTSHSGVMAHEFAHDLDWQAARREYGGTGWYRTDHALRQSVDKLAGALRQMASATRTDSSAPRMTGVSRPTEVLARNVDWFVSASLAREGRTNGYLSAAQDPVLTGYGSAITPEAAREGGSATLRALDGLTSVPSATRLWFQELFGAERRLTAHEAVRQVLEAPLGRIGPDAGAGFKSWDPPTSALGPGAGVRPWACLLESFAGADDAGTIRAVVQYTAESRARGILREWTELAKRRPAASPVRFRALTGAPWDPSIVESTFREIRDAILWSALADRERTAEGGWIAIRAETSGC